MLLQKVHIDDVSEILKLIHSFLRTDVKLLNIHVALQNWPAATLVITIFDGVPRKGHWRKEARILTWT
jgi:hypothetical protein